MTTTLDKPLRREIDIEGQAYTVVLDAKGIKITRKSHRKGTEHKWNDLIGDDEESTATSFAPPMSNAHDGNG
ncbi:hypothetical protein [Dyella sp. 2HG41-7]|uniref:hypothetical protein n=1 Tax=Dyella sp. 2HG41-7 TaxID=2883239 RepID=UPI001F2E10A6|nr:hypothetical protein [Dyella sp. 2HG41-7]